MITKGSMDCKSINTSSLRWIANVSESSWKPTQEQLKFLIGLQPIVEAQRIQRLSRTEDSKSAVMGRLMLTAAASQGLRKDASTIMFGRTRGSKPFIQDSEAAHRGLNANVSHRGDWVVLGMEEKGLIGVDVATTTAPRINHTTDEYFDAMSSQLSAKELQSIRAAGNTEEELFHAFSVIWALKEAYGKATGSGVCLPFSRLELSVPSKMLSKAIGENQAMSPWQIEGHVTATLDGILQKDWTFEVYILDNTHVMATAVGPHSVAVPSWKAAMESLKAADYFSCAAVVSGCDGPSVLEAAKLPSSPGISCLSISDLLGGAELQSYQRKCGPHA